MLKKYRCIFCNALITLDTRDKHSNHKARIKCKKCENWQIYNRYTDALEKPTIKHKILQHPEQSNLKQFC